ncbi:hypothetical protein KAS50_09435 [bacterium]|nr:hypothetical protein [bacterium]
MNDEVILQELENIFGKLGITIRYERGNFVGGLCRLKEDKIVILNRKLPVKKKILLLSQELSRFDIEEFFILPAVKEIILEQKEK